MGSMKEVSLADLRQELKRLDSCADDYERLSADKLADRSQVRQQFVMVSRRFHPDLHINKSQEFQSLTEEIFIRLSEAEQRLRKRLPPGQKRKSRRANVKPEANQQRATPTPTKQVSAPPKKVAKPKAPSSLGQPSPAKASTTAPMTSSSVPSAFLRRMRTGQSSHPSSHQAYAQKNATFGGRLSPQKALELAFQKMLQNPEDSKIQASAWSLRGQFALQQGEKADAIEFFHRACMLDRKCDSARNALTEIAEPTAQLEARLLKQLLGSGT